jgi:hypothetical protein
MNSYLVKGVQQATRLGNHRDVRDLSNIAERYIKGDLDTGMIVRIVKDSLSKQFHGFLKAATVGPHQ